MGSVADNFARHIAVQSAKMVVGVAEICSALAEFARAEHSYTDRTGKNTASIHGRLTEAQGDTIKGIFSAGMEYSVFLELARSGQWSFLMPVIERHRDELTQILLDTMGKGGGGGGGDAFGFQSNPGLAGEYDAYKTDARNGRARSNASGSD